MGEKAKKGVKNELLNKKAPFGYVYEATNLKNGKIYVGKAKEGRTGRGKNAIEKRWNEEIERARRLERWNKEHTLEKKRLRYIENAINKYGEKSFRLEKIDVAFTKNELNEKERYWINHCESRNHTKGYNLRDGGEGGTHHKKTKALLSKKAQENIKNPDYLKKLSIATKNLWKDEEYQEKVRKGVQKKYQEEEYLEKQIKERRMRGRNPEWRKKMTRINRERSKDPEWRKKISDYGLKKWKERDYVEKQLKSKEMKRKEIKDKKQFLKDIKEMKKKDIDIKYGLTSKTTNRHIRHLLGHRGVLNYTQAREFLKNKNIADILKDLEINKEIRFKEKIEKRQKLEDKKQFLEDIKEMQKKDIDVKYGITSKTTNSYIRQILGHRGVTNYTEARNYLKNKNLAEVLEDIVEDEKDIK